MKATIKRVKQYKLFSLTVTEVHYVSGAIRSYTDECKIPVRVKRIMRYAYAHRHYDPVYKREEIIYE